jgi:plasmid stabilization system protein ParE
MIAIRVLPQAEDDVVEIADLIATDHPDTAERFTAVVRKALEQLSAYPSAGPVFPIANRSLRGLRKLNLGGRFRRYLLFYLLRDNEALVIRVLDGSRDLDVLLAGETAEDIDG